MSMNKFMHPRNIYRTPPDYTKLAVDYPEFRQVSKIDLNGRVSIDYKNPETIRILTKTLLKRDFKLDVDIPSDKLVPTIPLRLNYILWIEDLMSFLNVDNVTGIDIGCGASCIYPLLAITMNNNWKMIGIETDATSVSIAQQNLTKNHLENRICLIDQRNGINFFENLPSNVDTFGFCMCNPPFFKSHDDLGYTNRTGNRKPPTNAFTGADNELIVDGGEVKFIQRIIDESLNLKSKINVYTSMIGQKSSIVQIVDSLKKSGITNILTTEFCQGRTTRWGIAWSFLATNLNDCPKNLENVKKPINVKPHLLKYNFPTGTKFENIEKFIQTIYERLSIEAKVLERHDNVSVVWELCALKNTWSNQRRKRRHQNTNDELDPVAKKIKLDDGIQVPVVLAASSLKMEESRINFEIGWLGGSAGKDGVHQILQFLINQWKSLENAK